jgi:hypothetical protein
MDILIYTDSLILIIYTNTYGYININREPHINNLYKYKMDILIHTDSLILIIYTNTYGYINIHREPRINNIYKYKWIY